MSDQLDAAVISSAAKEGANELCSSLEPPDSVLELCLAVKRNEASFAQVMKAMWLGKGDWAHAAHRAHRAHRGS